MEIPKKNKNRTTILTSNSTLGYLSKEDKKKNSFKKIYVLKQLGQHYLQWLRFSPVQSLSRG